MISRRTFLRRSSQTGLALSAGIGLGVGYGLWEACQIRINRQSIAVPDLPPAFAGTTVAVVADLHHGPFVSIEFIRRAVALVNSLQPDLIALVGDYAHRGMHAEIELPPCLEALSALLAPLGVYAIPGNHDMKDDGKVYRRLIVETPLRDLTNRNIVIEKDGKKLFLAGVDDLWWGKPDLRQALSGIPVRSPVVLLCHNPDYAETAPDPRVGLMLSGHTHGGQVYLPGIGSTWLPSKYGDKYRHGLVEGPASKVFVSRGLGEAGVPIRINVPPEVNLLTLDVSLNDGARIA